MNNYNFMIIYILKLDYIYIYIILQEIKSAIPENREVKTMPLCGIYA